MRLVWIGLLVAVLAAEAWALYHPAADDTLSHWVWVLRSSPAGRTALLGLWAWLTWHWFLESPRYRQYWHDDLVLTGLALLVGALLVRYSPAAP